jgi:tRNA/rRNA methyltransferase
VALVAHGWADASGRGAPAAFGSGVDAPATREELVGMMEHFEEALTDAGFFNVDAKKPVMIQNLRNAFTRGGWTAQEVRTFRGAIKALAVGRGKARATPPH